jgi:hypothetical protein
MRSCGADDCCTCVPGVLPLLLGMGLSSIRIGEPMRRDRLLLVSAFATALLTLLGAVGECLGMDRPLKSNNSKARTHSLFRPGCMLYDLIPSIPEHRLLPLIQKFNDAVSKRCRGHAGNCNSR